MWHFEYPKVFSGHRNSASNEICYCWGWGAHGRGGGGKNGTEKGQTSGNSCFCCQLPLVVLSVRVATSDEVVKGLLLQSCQPSVFLELPSNSIWKQNFRKPLRNKLCWTSKISCMKFGDILKLYLFILACHQLFLFFSRHNEIIGIPEKWNFARYPL